MKKLEKMVDPMLDKYDFETVAKSILQQEKELAHLNDPPPTRSIIRWKDNFYIGSIQRIVPNFSNEIVLLSKTSYIIPEGLICEIRKLDNGRLELDADESLCLSGRQHIVRLVENRLCHMNYQQTEYMTKNYPHIYEI